jgi:hypothetical protein
MLVLFWYTYATHINDLTSLTGGKAERRYAPVASPSPGAAVIRSGSDRGDDGDDDDDDDQQLTGMGLGDWQSTPGYVPQTPVRDTRVTIPTSGGSSSSSSSSVNVGQVRRRDASHSQLTQYEAPRRKFNVVTYRL